MTVIGHSVARAEILAKVALLLGPRDGPSFLEQQRETEWLLVIDGGGVTASAGLPRARTDG